MYEQLKALVDPTPNTVFVMGRHWPEKRLTGVYARHPGTYEYSGSVRSVTGEWPSVLDELRRVARDTCPEWHRPTCRLFRAAATAATATAAAAVDGVRDPASPDECACAASTDFDTALINHYRSGDDRLGMHRDKDAVGEPIASFSFYADDAVPPRDFHIKHAPSKRLMKLVLANGSVLHMLPGMQADHQHAVPERANYPHDRINVTLRCHHRSTHAPKHVRT